MKAAILTNNAYAIRYLFRTQSYEAIDTQAILFNVFYNASIKTLNVFCDYDPFIWYTKAPREYSKIYPFDIEKIQWALNRRLYSKKINNTYSYNLVFADYWLHIHNEIAQINSTAHGTIACNAVNSIAILNICSMPLFHFYMYKLVKYRIKPLKINKSQLIYPINPEKHHYLRIANRLGIIQFM